ncbi:hypothetical protein JQX09_17605 [Sulfitobacter pseudonitzschiae]|uniref:Uncharacterized protein n=1 Tax=Pseudosulfitobacter pseudonitzschiae TaxID=1402135 RepID=A0A9Q2RYL7_9RHOB|nr:hypothetical protein [Pseudosulfitobacter pseudonitzschiae]MBM2293748.1 hypothetical protein [Pseudosulfitobacter pseudonitzschiae]MBM2298666.1 hypothetical protein [Pseudosulfitobacter pseudonitzschiae]MBM2303580.1 hypothetical protein [Pseudosulfitobacter pseudonitzschiae]MBM2313363.1 hypothetical protein [Pseudosulfitobacter pseudonitzschiae]MBM2318276.1 hypothetical protein [Pseudosulfitobacter pseudonitzschiae]
MTVYKVAELAKWAKKAERRQDYVVAQSTNNLFDRGSRTAPGVTRGGVVKPGFIPRDLGFLAASQVSSLNGSTALSGENSYVFAIANMKAGDRAQLGWTAPYARRLHYAGWLWVDSAANDWQAIVADVVREAMEIER